jgi:hypothetical protein
MAGNILWLVGLYNKIIENSLMIIQLIASFKCKFTTETILLKTNPLTEPLNSVFTQKIAKVKLKLIATHQIGLRIES